MGLVIAVGRGVTDMVGSRRSALERGASPIRARDRFVDFGVFAEVVRTDSNWSASRYCFCVGADLGLRKVGR